MLVILPGRNPHPFSGAREYLYAKWWGREIEVGQPKRPQRKHRCNTHTIWPVIGPQEFLDLLARYDLGRYVCVHLIAEEQGCEETAEVHARTNG